jgi:hypothetical protein
MGRKGRKGRKERGKKCQSAKMPKCRKAERLKGRKEKKGRNLEKGLLPLLWKLLCCFDIALARVCKKRTRRLQDTKGMNKGRWRERHDRSNGREGGGVEGNGD